MKIIIKKVGEQPEIINVENTVEQLQQIVDGHLETVRVSDSCIMLCNEDGQRKNLPYNFDLGNQLIVGDVAFVQTDNGDFTDIDDANAEMIFKFFNKTPYQS